MSHFTEVKSKITNRELVENALKSLSFNYEANDEGVEVRGFYGDKIKCEIKISTGTKYDIGLRKTEDGTYEFVADWNMLETSKVNVEELRNSIAQKYSHLQIKKTLEDQGYGFVEEQVDENGAIQMVVSKW